MHTIGIVLIALSAVMAIGGLIGFRRREGRMWWAVLATVALAALLAVAVDLGAVDGWWAV